jgi:arginine utilization regulatory protein
MRIFDAIITVRDGSIDSVEWFSPELAGIYGSGENYIGLSLSDIHEFSFVSDNVAYWNKDKFMYSVIKAPAGVKYIIIKKDDELELLYKAALDLSNEGIEIYDENAMVIYFNKEIRKLLERDSMQELYKRHLIEIFNVDKDYSTTLTALRNKKPVINRFGQYESTNGKNIISINSAFPIFSDDRLIGAVSFESDIKSIEGRLEQLNEIKDAMQNSSTDIFSTKSHPYHFSDIVGSGVLMDKALQLARRISPTDNNVLLQGETGTGKELFAQSIHNASFRQDKNFIDINCAAIPENLIEGILFGTARGSFTGATETKGLFEEAENGTLFLDELNSMSLPMQSKLLRVLQDGKFRKVGGDKDISCNVRIIASSNEKILDMVENNTFRKDLFFRIATIIIDIPPLRAHIDDLESLIWHQIRATSHNYITNFTSVSDDVMELFRKYDWPGNIRELNHVIDYATSVSDSDVLKLEALPDYIIQNDLKYEAAKDISVDFSQSLQASLDQMEARIITAVLARNRGNITKSAEQLGLKRQSLQYRMKKYNIII